MTMQKMQKMISRIFFVMALCFSLVWGAHAVQAQEDHTLVLQLENYQEVVSQLPSRDGHRLRRYGSWMIRIPMIIGCKL